MKYKVNQHVRILAYPEGDINEAGRINSISRNDSGIIIYHVINYNMPYAGSVNEYFLEEELSPLK